MVSTIPKHVARLLGKKRKINRPVLSPFTLFTSGERWVTLLDGRSGTHAHVWCDPAVFFYLLKDLVKTRFVGIN